jgi:hypothetical protein
MPNEPNPDHQHLHDLLDVILDSSNQHLIAATRFDLEVYADRLRIAAEVHGLGSPVTHSAPAGGPAGESA